MSFPTHRPRRLRRTEALRNLVRETRLAKSGLLYLVTEKFGNIDLHPAAVSNAQMGAVFEELIRKFAESNNAQAGDEMLLASMPFALW